MRITHYVFLTLAALAGVFTLAAPAALAADPCVDAANQLKSGAACLVDLNTKWNELVVKLMELNAHLNKALGSIEAACEAMDSDDECSPSAFLAVDTDLAKEHADDAAADLENAQALISEINGEVGPPVVEGIIDDFQEELTAFQTKLNGGTDDYPLSDRVKNSAHRTAVLIDTLMDGLGTTLTDLAVSVAACQTDLDDFNTAEATGDEDGMLEGLASALVCVERAMAAKDRALRKQVSQVKKALGKLQTLFRVAINKTKARLAMESDRRAQIYTLAGQLVIGGPAAALDRQSLANGVYVVAYSDGRVEKLVVLH
jgi:hypothetical protein